MTTSPSLPLEEVSLPNWPFSSIGIAYGQGAQQLEVLYSAYDRSPSPTQLRSAWKTRQNRRGVPLLVVVLHNEKAHVCGPSGDDPTVYPDLDPGQVERICQEALERPSRQAALRALRDSLGSLENDGLPGLRNEGFLASHELVAGVPLRPDWAQAKDKALKAVAHTGKNLLTSLGFTIESLDKVTHVLRVGDRKAAVAVLLIGQETPETGSPRIPGSLSPVSYALARADEENLDWVVLIHDRKIRLYPVKMGVGVGRKGRTETFLECHTGLIPDDQAAYLWLLFSADALAEDGSLESILSDSKDFAGELANRLRERIYDHVVPRLAEGMAEARGLKKPTAQELSTTYQMTMRVLFRLLFIAYGEDKDLLPYRFNGLYQKRSLKAKAKELLDIDPDQFDNSDSWWVEVQNLWTAVDKGNRDWGVPAYNGGLFSSDPDESEIGAALSEVSLPNRVFGPALQHLLLVPTSEGVLGPVDFRSLGVREFGTIYEGLLESELAVAQTDLAVETRGKNKDAYRPCKEREEPTVAQGAIYLHNASGARKATGSYYTKHFAVEHLLDRSLESALDDHFGRLDALDELEAAEAFFDFRVADIAMGSGHFLVAAVDRIEARFSRYLVNRPLPQVAQEFSHLRKAAVHALGDAADSYPDFEDASLLRRLIARRCIYGVDINEVAVQLARLAIWIHTFVPGLPLSLLDRNLIHGNSLVGIGRLDEFSEAIESSNMPLLQVDTNRFLGDAGDSLARLGQITEATKTEIQQARMAWQEATAAVEPTRALCDILTAARIEAQKFPVALTNWEKQKASIVGGKQHAHALTTLKRMSPVHFPIAFPEVFLRERGGFDVILGNPPWEEATIEEDAFWGRHRPGGLRRTLSQREQERVIAEFRKTRPDLVERYEAELMDVKATRQALMRGPFPGMGTGDPDLYKAFCWRFWFLIAKDGGRFGVVLPRSALTAKGSTEFRLKLLLRAEESDITTLVNKKTWVFDDGHAQQTYGLVAVKRGDTTSSSVTLQGPYSSHPQYRQGSQHGGASLVGKEIASWNDSASLPLLPSSESFEVFRQLRKAPRLDLNDSMQWRARPHTELHATNDKRDKKTGQVLMDLESEECPEDFWPVYKGESFNLWQPDTGIYYAWGDTAALIPKLQAKRMKGNRLSRSVFFECDANWCADPSTLPCLQPRIAFRDITQWDNRRTIIAALIPPGVFLSNTGPYLVFSRGDSASATLLLAVMASIPFDWYARRFVELHVNFYIFNPLPVPRPGPDSSLRQRAIELAGRLACPDDRFADWAKEIGVECGPLEEDDKQDMIHELDAVVAHLYGLTGDHLTHIFETFHVGWDYHARLDATLGHFKKWEPKR